MPEEGTSKLLAFMIEEREALQAEYDAVKRDFLERIHAADANIKTKAQMIINGQEPLPLTPEGEEDGD